ncbi:MAG: hypothetical protein K2P46_07840 [Alistipes sp.]|nr:hypothetical protein [Alistipes sp.]
MKTKSLSEEIHSAIFRVTPQRLSICCVQKDGTPNAGKNRVNGRGTKAILATFCQNSTRENRENGGIVKKAVNLAGSGVWYNL